MTQVLNRAGVRAFLAAAALAGFCGLALSAEVKVALVGADETPPVATAASSVRRASLSIPSMRRTSITSNASARAQSAVTRSWP